MLHNQPPNPTQRGRDGTMEAASRPNEGLFAPGSFLEKLNSVVKGIGCPNPNVRRAQRKASGTGWTSFPGLALSPAGVPVARSSSSSRFEGLPPVASLPVSIQQEPATQPVTEASVSSAGGSKTAAHPPPAPTAPHQASSMAQEPPLQLPAGASGLDERAQQLDAEINELIQRWESGAEAGEAEGLASSVLLKSKGCQADPMDLNDEFIREDPAYDAARVEREALEADAVEGRASSSTVPPSSPSSCPVQPYAEAAPDSRRRYSLRPRGSAKALSAQEEEEEGDPSGGSTEESSAWEEEEAYELSPQWQRKRQPQGGPAPRVYPCPTCGQKFANSSNMRKHLRIHTREAPYVCRACGKSFTDPSNLSKHQRVHSGPRERPFGCSKCPKAFASAPNLQEHLRRHEGIRPFPCMDCQRSFVSQAELVAHIRSHVGQPRKRAPQPLLHCEDCDKSFTHPKRLRSHQHRHKSLVCGECGAVFTRYFKFLFHKSQHKGPQTCARCGVQYTGGHFCQSQASRTGQGKARAPGPSSSGLRAPNSSPALNGAPAPTGPPAPAPARPPAPAMTGTPAPPAADPPARGMARSHGSNQLRGPAPPTISAPASIPLTSDPIAGVISKHLILLNPATLPLGTKIILQLPPQPIVPARDMGTRAGGAAAFLPQAPVLGRMPELPPASATAQQPAGGPQGEFTSGGMPAEKGNGPRPLPAPPSLQPTPPSAPLRPPAPSGSPQGPPRPLPAPPPPAAPPQLPAPSAALRPDQGAAHKPYTFRRSQPQVKYVEEGEGSNLGGNLEEDWTGQSGAEEEKDTVPQGKKRGRGQPRLGRYGCQVCAKRFVYQRSLKQHMRLSRHAAACPHCHAAFSDPHKLQRHVLGHGKEATA